MKSDNEIQAKIAELQKDLDMILGRFEEEMSKVYTKRDYKLLKFLNREQHIWEFAIRQLQWVAGNEPVPIN